jgi:hypothetical protein
LQTTAWGAFHDARRINSVCWHFYELVVFKNNASNASVVQQALLYMDAPALVTTMYIFCLQVLVLSGHNFSGTLPASWTRLKQLRVLDVSHNSLAGNLPSWYVSMRQLAVLKVHNNQLVPMPNGDLEFCEYLVGDSSQLQCISVGGNNGMIVDNAKKEVLERTAQRSLPPVALVINEPDNVACDVEKWK